MGYSTTDGPSGKGLGQFTNSATTQADFNKVLELVARMGNLRVGTTAEKNALVSPARYDGLLFHDTTADTVELWDGSGWVNIYRTPVMGRATNTTATSVPSGVDTMVTLTGAGSANVVSGGITFANSRFTVGVSGRYRVKGSGRFQTNGTGFRRLAIDVNDAAPTIPIFTSVPGQSGTEIGVFVEAPDLSLTAGDTVRLKALHDVAATIEFRGPTFTIERIA